MFIIPIPFFFFFAFNQVTLVRLSIINLAPIAIEMGQMIQAQLITVSHFLAYGGIGGQQVAKRVFNSGLKTFPWIFFFFLCGSRERIRLWGPGAEMMRSCCLQPISYQVGKAWLFEERMKPTHRYRYWKGGR